jgi:hypothetical protein
MAVADVVVALLDDDDLVGVVVVVVDLAWPIVLRLVILL